MLDHTRVLHTDVSYGEILKRNETKVDLLIGNKDIFFPTTGGYSEGLGAF